MNAPMMTYKWLMTTDPSENKEQWLQLATSLRILAYEASYPLITKKMFENVERRASDAGVVIPKS